MIRKELIRFFDDGFKCPVCSLSSIGLCPSCSKLVEKIYYKRQEPFPSYTVCFYNNFLKELYSRYKFEEESYLYVVFSKLLSEMWDQSEELQKSSWISYIPMSRRKKFLRGYNPCEDLARELAKEKKIHLVHALEKTRNTREQNKLNREERMKNVKGAFRVKRKGDSLLAESFEKRWRKGKISLNSLRKFQGILLDDLLTTGATMGEAIHVLEEEHLKVCALTLATTKYPKEGDHDEDSISGTINDIQ